MTEASRSTVPHTTEQRRRLVALLAQRAGVLTTPQRQILLEDAGLDRFAGQLTFDSDAEGFAAELVRELQQVGLLDETGDAALVSLLRVLRERVRGHPDEVAQLDTLLVPYQRAGNSTRPLKLL